MGEQLPVPGNYFVDEADPDVVILRNRGGSFVAAFSAMGVTKESIAQAAEEDHSGSVDEDPEIGPPFP